MKIVSQRREQAGYDRVPFSGPKRKFPLILHLQFRGCGEASEGSCQNDKIACGGFETFVRFRNTSAINAPVPNPLFSNVRALASHNPSGDRDCADQIVAGPQPDAKAQAPTITKEIARRNAAHLPVAVLSSSKSVDAVIL
jgi:hypothetical protein